ncbi:hypothetical protein COP2_021321 [Malus domestica]
MEIEIKIEIEIEIGKGEGERETKTERQREKEREEWGSRRHCCRSLIFFDPISDTQAHQRLHFLAKHHHSLRSAQDTQAKAFHCAVAPATAHRLLLRDSPLPTSREKVAAAAVGKNKVFSCLCDCLCPSNF